MTFLDTHDLPKWHEQAECRDYPSEYFFGKEELPGKQRHRPALNMAEVKRAKSICAECPVQRECLSWALSRHEEFGVWSSTTGRDRAKFWRAAAAAKLAGESFDALAYIQREFHITLDSFIYTVPVNDPVESDC